jgi:acetyl-CoA acetyltransferase
MNTIAPVNTPDIRPDTGEVAGPRQFEVPYGLGYLMQRTALRMRRYMHHYGVTADQIGWVAVVERQNAMRNPHAFQKQPLSLDDYLSSRWIAEPLRMLDCDIPVNGACAYVITSADRARSLRHPPVYVTATAADPRGNAVDEHLMGEPAEGMVPLARELYTKASSGPGDMDIAYPYDGFAYFVPVWLEHLGLFTRGEAAAFIEGGRRVAPDGELPINTHGGNLSAGRMHAQHHVIEAVEQLRGSAGARQVAKPLNRAVLSMGVPGGGFVGILSRER